MILIRHTPLRRRGEPYEPPAFIQRTDPKFWPQTAFDGDHLIWQGKIETQRRRVKIVCSGGVRVYLHDFAYLSKKDAIWFGLAAVPTCGEELCVHPDHLTLRRAGRTRQPLTEAEFDVLAELFWDRRGKRPHKELWDAYEIARAYGVDGDTVQRELDRRVVILQPAYRDTPVYEAQFQQLEIPLPPLSTPADHDR